MTGKARNYGALLVAAGAVCAAAPTASPFTPLPPPQAIHEQFQVFAEAVAAEDWAQVCAVSELLATADDVGLLDLRPGLLVPWREAFAARIRSLPGAGRAAFRLFYDARAGRALAAVAGCDGKAWGQLVRRYPVTPAAELAAAQLGDLAWERADFAGAIRCWRLLGEQPRARLKEAIALAALGRRDAFQQLGAELQGNPEPMVLAGRAATAAEHLRAVSVTADRGGDPPAAAAPLAAPLWQHGFAMGPALERIEPVRQANLWSLGYYALKLPQLIPEASITADRLYVNYLGACSAIDLATGGILWQTAGAAEFFRVPEHKLRQRLQYLRPGIASFAVAADAASVAVTGWRPDSGEAPITPELALLAPATGDLWWRSGRIPDLADLQFVGRPCLDGARVYICAIDQKHRDLILLGLHRDDGSTVLRVVLGLLESSDVKHAYNPYMTPQPECLRDGQQLFVGTGYGALAAVDLAAGELSWVWTYPLPPRQDLAAAMHEQPIVPVYAAGPPLVFGGRLYYKAPYSDRLSAFDLIDRGTAWSAEVSPSSRMLGSDGEWLYLSGPAPPALALASGEPRAAGGVVGRDLPADTRELRTVDYLVRLSAEKIEGFRRE